MPDNEAPTEDSGEGLAVVVARAAEAMSASDIVILDVGDSMPLTQYFILGTGLNVRHLKSVVNDLQRAMKNRGVRRRGLEGYPGGNWVLLDLGDVVVHLFIEESRKFYDLELLWGDSRRCELPPMAEKRVAP